MNIIPNPENTAMDYADRTLVHQLELLIKTINEDKKEAREDIRLQRGNISYHEGEEDTLSWIEASLMGTVERYKTLKQIKQ